MAEVGGRRRRRVTISSTYVRASVAAGDMASAARALGRPHRVDGVVVRGDRRGRELGYPTANVEAPPTPPSRPTASTPATGAARRLRRQPHAATRRRSRSAPTRRSRARRTVEAYLLDFDGDLYGEHIGVEFVAAAAADAAFAGVEELVEAMGGGRGRAPASRCRSGMYRL